MKIRLKNDVDGLRAGLLGEALRFDETESYVVHFTCIFYGLPGTYVLTQGEIESLDS